MSSYLSLSLESRMNKWVTLTVRFPECLQRTVVIRFIECFQRTVTIRFTGFFQRTVTIHFTEWFQRTVTIRFTECFQRSVTIRFTDCFQRTGKRRFTERFQRTRKKDSEWNRKSKTRKEGSRRSMKALFWPTPNFNGETVNSSGPSGSAFLRPRYLVVGALFG